ncbi:MAG: DNA/RNA non-specific endonuclease [Bacteroidales bacterium]|nr:DNA/RNA non-specific endonuclease [Bacteroidales bacterium]
MKDSKHTFFAALAAALLLAGACTSPTGEPLSGSQDPVRPVVSDDPAAPSRDPQPSDDPGRPSDDPQPDASYRGLIEGLEADMAILQRLVEAYERDIPVASVEGEDGLYSLFVGQDRYEIACDYNEQGVPAFGAMSAPGGFCWTAEGESLADDAYVTSGIPALRVLDGRWQVAWGDGAWKSLGEAAPAAQLSDIFLFSGLTQSASAVTISFADGTSVTLVKEEGEDPPQPAGLTATVTTGSASSLTVSSAVLSASYSVATTAPREVGFEWGTTSGNLDRTLQSPDICTGTSGSFRATLEGLGDGKTYYYRAYVVLQRDSEIKYFYGPVRSFTTQTQQDKPQGSQAGWFELPVMNIAKSGSYMYNSQDPTQYYAYHLCAGGERGPSGRTARNYTVCYSERYHCPLWVAAPLHSMYKGGSGRSEAYGEDPDIPYDSQWHSKSNASGFNKGHMLGSADRSISTATNRQVYYYPNIAPQLSAGFNTSGGGWNTLEDYVDGQVCSDTLYAVIGCYFDKFTDGYGNTVSPRVLNGWSRTDVAMPTMFYYVLLRTKSGSSRKAVTACSASELQCVAFVRSHTNDLKGQKVTSREMMSVSDLEKITGVTYFPNVPNAPKTTYNPSDWDL